MASPSSRRFVVIFQYMGAEIKTSYLLCLCLLSGVLSALRAQQIPAAPGPSPSIDNTASTPAQQRCSQLQASDKRIDEVHAVFVPAGGFTDPTKGTVIDLPAFCRVSIVAKPEPDSNIRIELWLPVEHWNGEFYGVGNGGGGGNIGFGSLYPALRRGFAVANTDLGTSPNADSVVAIPARWADFGFRATHEMAVISKQMIKRFYDMSPRRSIFYGCSTGGQQALREAQDFPADFNGIIAGAPANNRTHLHSMFVWNYQATHAAGDDSILPSPTLDYVHRQVLAACKTSDTGAPGDTFLTDARSCRFNFDSLVACDRDRNTECVSAAQREALKKIYSGPSNPRTGQQIYAGMPLGSEASKGGILTQEDSHPPNLYLFRWALGTGFDPKTFDFDKDEKELDVKTVKILNANSPDLHAFHDLGGKLLMFSGTADGLVPYPDTLAYYERVVKFESPKDTSASGSSRSLTNTRKWFRYYLVPGMDHCGGGPGIDAIGQTLSENGNDLEAYVERWLDREEVPLEIKGVHTGKDGKPEWERPVCAYPEFPAYIKGDEKLGSSFSCRERARGSVPDSSAYLP